MTLIRCVQGSLHQGSKLFRNPGVQCTVIAYVALLTIFRHHYDDYLFDPSHLNAHDIDGFVINGNQMYEEIIRDNSYAPGHLVAHDELPSLLNVGEGIIESSIYYEMLYGIVGETEYDVGTGAISIYDALDTGMQISDYLLCTVNDMTFAIIHINDMYYILDSHSRDVQGNIATYGSAVLLQFNDISSMLEYLHRIYFAYHFNISPVIPMVMVNNSPEISHNNSNTAVDRENELDGISKIISNNNSTQMSPSDSNRVTDGKSNLNRNSRILSDEIDKYTLLNVEQYRTVYSENHTYSCSKPKRKKLSHKKSLRGESCGIPSFCSKQGFGCLSQYDGFVAAEIEVSSYSTANLFEESKKNDCIYIDKKEKYDAFNFKRSIESAPTSHCDSCDKFLFDSQVYSLSVISETLNKLQLTVDSKLCRYCMTKIKAGKIPCTNSQFNNLDPGEIPLCLKQLSLMEKRLISKIHVFLTIIFLPGGQFAERGLSIDFPVNLEESISKLPHEFSKCNIIAVTYGENTDLKPTHLVKKKTVSQCLRWLQKNNPLYKNVTIDLKHLHDKSDIDDSRVKDFSDFEEYGVVNIDNSVPDININKVINSDIPVLKLLKCKSNPINAYDKMQGEESAFPYLFPYGINGFRHSRPINIDMSNYFKHRLQYKDGRFRRDVPYMMHALNYVEYQRLINAINIHMRMRKSKKITAKDVKNIDTNHDLLQNSYMFMKNIRGTAAYWKNNLQNLLCMFQTLGTPSIFLTLSANDHWPDLISTLNGCEYVGNHAGCTVRGDPYMTAFHFQRRFESLLKNIICGSVRPLGKVTDYFTRIEFQNRGSPHVHMFLWIENFHSVFENQNELILYIDKTISTSGKDENAKQYQTHCHTDYCMRKFGKCRFGFPFRQCIETKLINNVDISTETSLRGRFYELRRLSRDAYINAYNPTILKYWQANMDIQIIGNAQSAAYYVCAYLCKSEPEDLKLALANVINNLEENCIQRTRMAKIGCCVLKTRKLSAQEAAYRLSGLPLIKCSRSFLFVSTKQQSDRYRVLKPKTIRDELSDNSTDIFISNILDYYRFRPIELGNVCLYQFARWYTKCEKPKTSSEKGRGRKAEARLQLLHPFDDIYIRKRVKFIVVRFPNIPIHTDAYFFHLLMAYLPHRIESDVFQNEDTNKEPYTNARDAFMAKKEDMDLSNLQTVSVINEIENAVRFIRCTQIELASHFNPCTVETDTNNIEIMANVSFPPQQNDLDSVESTLFENDSKMTNTYMNDSSDYLHNLDISSMSYSDLQNKMKTLTTDQQNVMMHVMQHYRSKKREPLHMFISGGGGVGKSYLTKLIINWLQICTSSMIGVDPVVVCAPTGTAAKNILGKTVHSALHIPVQHGKQPEYLQLNAKTLKKLRQIFKLVHTIIIDEISMVSSVMLEHIHRRLCAIKDNEEKFGGLNVIVVGDFFQLRPVRGKFPFENNYLWKTTFKPFFLNKNVRQLKDSKYASLLCRARLGVLTKQDVALLNSRILTVPEDEKRNILHLYPKNKQVKAHNDMMQNSFKNRSIFTIPAKHYFSQNDICPKEMVQNELIPDDDRDAGGLINVLKVSIGTRIMLIRNIYTSQGLVNGAMGYVEEIERNNIEANISLIYVKFDDPEIGKQFQNCSYQNAIPIEPICQEFYCKGRVIIREQFPLIPAWACTIHKVQGASLDKVAVSIGNDVFEKGMAYVALSRVKELRGLYLLSFNSNKVRPYEKALIENSRLQLLSTVPDKEDMKQKLQQD